MKRFTLLVTLLFSLGSLLKGQELPAYDISFPEPTTGCTVRHIEIDDDGFIWIATPNGVERYDGRTFRAYHLSNTRERSITDGFMIKIKAAKGTIWTSTERGVVTCYDPKGDKFTKKFNTSKGEIWASGNCFYPTKEGMLIGTTSGLLPYYTQGDSIGDFVHTDLSIKAIIGHPDGKRLLLATFNGIKIYDPVTQKAESYSSIEGEINVIYNDTINDCLWVGAQGSGLYIVDNKNLENIKHVSTTDNMIVNVITPLNDNTLLIGTDGDGLLATYINDVRTDKGISDCKLILLASESNDAPCRLTNSVIDDIVVDGDKLWLALSLGGMALMQPKNENNILSNPEAETYADGFAFGVDVDRDGRYWVAFSRCLARYDAPGMKPVLYSFPGMGNLCLKTASDGTVWFGGYNTGLRHYNPTTGHLDFYPSVSGQAINDCIYAIHEDYKHDLWVGGSNLPLTCLLMKPDGTFDTKSYEIYQISDIAELNADTLIITTFDSFYMLDIRTGEMKRLLTGYDGIIEWTCTNAIASVVVRHNREIWFATQGAGLVCYDAQTGDIQKYGADLVLPSLELCGVELINDSILCVSTEHNGLFTFNANTRTPIRNFNYDPVGRGKGVFMRGASGTNKNGTLIFGTDCGAIVVNSDYINAPQDTFNIIAVSDFMVNGGIVLPSTDRTLMIEFTTTDIYHQNDYLFEYRIKGLVDDWQPVGESRVLRYQSLSPGSYTVEVRSNSASSYITGIEIPLRVNPVIWLRWYFIVLYSIIGVSILYFLIHHYQIKKLSEIDGLTGIANRYAGQRRIVDLLKNHRPGVFVLFDCDHFKLVNDNHGHDVGDELIKALANTMKATFPDQITMRLGGDEFAFFLQGYYSKDLLKNQIDRLIEGIKTIKLEAIPDYKVSISGGAAFYDGESDETFEQLYKEADKRLYTSKQYRNFSVTME